jgi:hypothetical protein
MGIHCSVIHYGRAAGISLVVVTVSPRPVLPGRHGITTFAISGADIALWDLAAKAAGVSLAELLGGRRRSAVPAYASLVRYGDGDLVERYAREVGYREIKLHEITMPEICRARAAGARTSPPSSTWPSRPKPGLCSTCRCPVTGPWRSPTSTWRWTT